MKTLLQKINDYDRLSLISNIDYKKKMINSQFARETVIEIGVGLEDVVLFSIPLMNITGNLKDVKKKEYEDKLKLFHESVLILYNEEKSSLKDTIQRILE